MMMNKESSHWWWLDSHHTSSGSPWLQSTLTELDKKTKSMLKLIEAEAEADADSFAQRAEMYYNKRPELISMVEDFYRAHRSLAERCDKLKSDSGNRLLEIGGSPFSTKNRPDKLLSVETDQTYDSHSETDDAEDIAESEVHDPEQDQIQADDEELGEVETPEEGKETHAEDSVESEEDNPEQDQIQVDEGLEEIETAEEKEETHSEDPVESESDDVERDQIQVGEELEEIEIPEENRETRVDGGVKHVEVRTMYNAEVSKLKEEIERLEAEKRIYKDYLLQKDEEMRERKKEIPANEGMREAEISRVMYNVEVMKLREEIERLREEKTISKDRLLQKHDEKREEKSETQVNEGMKEVEFSSVLYDVEVMKLREKLEGFEDDNKICKEHLLQKDEEKREVIRQLSLAFEVLKLENTELRKYVARDSSKKRSRFTVKKLKDTFLGKLFNAT